MRRTVALHLALLVMALLAAGCGPWRSTPSVTLASGQLGDSSWSLVLEDADDGVCLEVVFPPEASGVCPGEGRSFGINVFDDPGGNGSILIAQVDDRTMVEGDVTFDLRPGAPVRIVDMGQYGRVAVATIEGDQQPLRVVLRNADGTRTRTLDVP